MMPDFATSQGDDAIEYGLRSGDHSTGITA